MVLGISFSSSAKKKLIWDKLHFFTHCMFKLHKHNLVNRITDKYPYISKTMQIFFVKNCILFSVNFIFFVGKHKQAQNTTKMSEKTLNRWLLQIYRRFQRWYTIDPEYVHYLPDHQSKFRYPSPSFVFF